MSTMREYQRSVTSDGTKKQYKLEFFDGNHSQRRWYSTYEAAAVSYLRIVARYTISPELYGAGWVDLKKYTHGSAECGRYRTMMRFDVQWDGDGIVCGIDLENGLID